MKKDVVAGLGEIGYPVLKLLSKKQTTVGYDIDKNSTNRNKYKVEFEEKHIIPKKYITMVRYYHNNHYRGQTLIGKPFHNHSKYNLDKRYVMLKFL